MPPWSSTPVCSLSSEITGCGVCALNSVELAPMRPSTLRANSMTMICMPRQTPRYGMLFSRAYRAASSLPSMPRSPKPRADEDAVDALEQGRDRLLLQPLGVQPADVDARLLRDAGVDQRFLDGQVGVVQLDVLADDRDLDLARRVLQPVDHQAPRRRSRGDASSFSCSIT